MPLSAEYKDYINTPVKWKYGYIDSKGTFIPVDVQANKYAQISSKAKPVFYNVETKQYFEYSQVLGNDVGGDARSKRIGVWGIKYFLTKGTTEGLTKEAKGYVKNFIKENGGEDTWANYDPTAGFSEVQKKYIKTIAPVITSEEAQANAKEDAFNDYYKDLYSLREGTQGKEMYDRLTETYINEADAQYNLADASYQQMALQQAQVVKQITDRVRSERMARLRAGMSESQIANQDMQMLMANVDALNQQAYAMQQQKLEAQTNRGLAQDKAYNDYLAQTAQKGQTAAALYASDVANPTMQTLQKLWQLYPNGGWTTEDYERVSNEVTGYQPPKP